MIQKNKISIYIIPITLIILIEFFSLHYAQFHYDGFHIGLLLNVANDLDAGKLIYKDFFYEYGILNGYLNLLILKIFDNNIYSLYVVYSQFFISGVVLLYLLSKKFFGSNYALLFLIVIFIIHPYLIKPWHNYLLFFFISGYLYLKSFFNVKYELFSSLILGFIFLFSETFFVTSFLILIVDLIFSLKIFGRKIFLKKIFLFISPLLLFFIYLFLNDLIDDWILYNETYPILLKNFYKTDIISFIINHLKIFVYSYKTIYSDTIIFFYSIIYLSNFVFIIIYLKKFIKNKLNNEYLFFLLVASINLILISQIVSNMASFKLVTISSFGFLILLLFVKNIREPFFKKNSSFNNYFYFFK